MAQNTGTARSAAPAEVLAPPANVQAYENWRKADTLRAPYTVGSALVRGIRQDAVETAVECPLLCFVNARSGGLVGAELALRLSQAVGRVQVFDIGDKDYRPDKVLSRFYDNLRSLEASGDPRAATVRQRMRLLVCGGDGTIAWIMGVIKKLKLQPEPPIAIMPLGTGNDLSRAFNWGAAYNSGWVKNHQAMYNTLNRIATAVDDRLDCWAITITAPRKALLGNHLPHSLTPPPPPTPAVPATFLTPHARLSSAPHASAAALMIASASNAGFNRGQSSGLNAVGAVAGGGGSVAGSVLHSGMRDLSAAGIASERSVGVSVMATVGSATPLQNIATSSVGSAATTFTTATNMSMHTYAAQAGTSVPPTIVSGAVSMSAEDETGIGVVGGNFWNYFSVGLDAKAAWGFHSLREERPGCTSTRLANQFWYTFFSCSSGWFCCAQPVNLKVTLEVLKPGPAGESAGWQPVKLPSNVKALVVLNLQSYAGGRNLWGPRTSPRDEKNYGYKKPSVSDGLLEVVGLRSGWHTGVVMGTKGKMVHAARICQAAGVRLAISAPYVRADGEPSHCYMQIDGEPWKQDIPVKGQEAPVRVEIVHAGVSRVLRNVPRDLASGFSVSSQKVSTARSRGPGGAAGAAAGAAATVNAVPEPVTPPVAASQSQSSIQLPVAAPVAAASLPHSTALASVMTPSGGGAAAGAYGAPTVASVSGALLHQTTHGSQSISGAVHAAWTRVGSAGRPSTASVAGSSSAAGADTLVSTEVGGAVATSAGGGAGGGGAATVRVPVPVVKPGDVADGGTTPSETQFAATPRTLSTDLGSQGGRSIALPE